MSDKTPFQRVVDDLTDGCGCGCHTGIGYNAACRHCVPQFYPPERSAGAAPIDVEGLPSGARLSLQKGDDYGNGPWYAVVENTIDLPDQDTARLGSGQTPQEAMDAAISRYARLSKGTDR